MYKRAIYRVLLFPILLLGGISPVFSQDDGIPPRPKQQTAVYDYADILTAQEEAALKNKLIHYADTTSTQIVVVSIPSLEGRNINFFAANWAHKWGIGQKGKGNGVLILLAEKDRKISIQVGYGMEHLLTDAMSRRIIERDMIPHFREGDYYAGLDAGTTAVMRVMSGEYENDQAGGEEGSIIPFLVIFIFIVILMIIITRNGGSGGGGRNVIIDDSPVIILGRGGRTGGFGGGFGGGGFGGGGFSGGFGGGGFGGGGASGSW